MISSIFYFADTEQEYLDNYNRHQVKPYTIVFCRDTKALWKNGIRYGGSNQSEVAEDIRGYVEENIEPLLEQLDDAIAAANGAADRANTRLDGISGDIELTIRDFGDSIGAEKERFLSEVGKISDQIDLKVLGALDQYQNLVNDLDGNISTWFSKVAAGEIAHTDGWNDALNEYMQGVGYFTIDPETGQVTSTMKSEVIQKASEIVLEVTGVTVGNDGTVDVNNVSLTEQIGENKQSIITLEGNWAEADEKTKKILQWMAAGLSIESSEEHSFAELYSAASSGEHSGMSNILTLVEKIPYIKKDPQTGENILDEDGNPVYETDEDGNVLYQKYEDGSYKYRAKANLTAAIDGAVAGLMTNVSSEIASTELFADMNGAIAGWKAFSTGDISGLLGVVTNSNFAAALEAVTTDEWAQTTLTAKLRVQKKDSNGNLMYDQQGNPIYEDVSDVLGSIRTSVETLNGGPQVTNSIDAKVKDALSTFEQLVTGEVASTTAINKLGPALSGLVSKVTGDSSSATMMSKLNNMEAAVVTTANLETAVVGLIARGDAKIVLTCTSLGGYPTGTLNASSEGGIKALPSSISNLLNVQGDKVTLTGIEFNTAFADTNVYRTTINTQIGPQDTYVPLKYVAGETGVQSGSTPYYAISDGEYLFKSGGQVIKITIADLNGSVFSRVNEKIGEATSGLVAENALSGKMAAILATASQDGSKITISGDAVEFDTAAINAVTAQLNVGSVVTNYLKTNTINANKIVAGADDWATIVDEGGVRIYNSGNGHEYVKAEDDYYYRGEGNYVDKKNEPNSILQDDGAGWLANRNVEWDKYGNTHIGPVDTEQGLSIKTVDGSTKIILKGDIIADGLNLKAGLDSPTTYGTGGSKGDRNVVTRISGYGFSTGLEQLQTYNNGPTDYGDMIRQEDAPDDDDDKQSLYSCVDWGAIAIVKGGQNSTANVPMAKNSSPRNYSLNIGGSKPVPGSALVVKGYDGCGYRGFTGTVNGMSYINGIAIGPDVPNSAIYDINYTFNQNDTYL